MAKKISISIISNQDEYYNAVKSFIENLGYKTKFVDLNSPDKMQESELYLFLVNEINQEIISFIENNINKHPVILNYNQCPNEISIDSLSSNILFHKGLELNTLPILIENAILKNKLSKHSNKDSESDSKLFELMEIFLSEKSAKTPLEKFILDSLEKISHFVGANEYNFFVFPKFKNFNKILYRNFTEKYDISQVNEIYPDLDTDAMIQSLQQNQVLIMFKKNGNVKTDITNSKSTYYYNIIAVPININNVLYGTVLYNFHSVIQNINKVRKELFFISKFFSFKLQYKIIYNQYESSINQFSRLINDAINGIYQSTEDGKIIYANPAFLKIVGYESLSELKNIDLFTDLYVSKSDRQKFVKKINEEKSVLNYDSVIKRKNGNIVNIIENSRVVENLDGSRMYEGIVHDITNQINLKEKLKYQTSFSEKIIENAPFLIIAFNEKSQVILWNSTAEKVTGYERNEIYSNLNFVNKLFSNIDSIEDHLSLVLKNEKYINEIKNDISEIVAKDGAKKILRWSWTANDALSNDNKLVLGFGLDITETKNLEEQLFESQKMESIGTLAAGMAYDFTKILNELNVYNSSLKSILEEGSKEISYTTRIEDTIQKASTFTSKIIGLSRTDKKKTTLVDLNTGIDYVIDLLENTIDNNIIIEKEICNEPLIEGDIAQIHQFLLNIAINAAESIEPPGKIIFKSEIVLAKSEEFFNTINPLAQNYVKITIKDTGKGIPIELQKRIFDPFFTSKPSGKSAGLGLSVAYNIIKNHKGYVFVDSEMDNGSRFSIYLPYAGESSDSIIQEIIDDDADEINKKSKSRKNYKILVVDDEIIIRDLLNDVLIDQNYEIILAKDGIDGLETYKKNIKSIDLVILDIIMPGMSGNEVFEKIRNLNSEAKVIITSGYSKQTVTQELMSKGANGFLPKPFNIDKLLGLIKALIEEN